MLDGLFDSFIMLLVIMDPFGGLPIFLTLTKEYSDQRIKRSAFRAIRVSAILLFLFLIVGENVLTFFGITIFSFQVGGGLILLMLGLMYVLDVSLSNDKDYSKDIIIPMATPLIAGPGAITAIIILVN
jgi:multiple antibiotic resistance protein